MHLIARDRNSPHSTGHDKLLWLSKFTTFVYFLGSAPPCGATHLHYEPIKKAMVKIAMPMIAAPARASTIIVLLAFSMFALLRYRWKNT